MRIAISNIAWDTSEDEQIAALLSARSLDAIDIAHSKYFPLPAEATDRAIRHVRQWWSDRGIDITGMQALLFGTQGLNVFGPRTVRDAMLAHLAAVCRIADGLGARRLVFGSPRNRDRSALTDDETHERACGFFNRLGDIAQSHRVVICLEPNPASYGANFMTSSDETADVVESVGHAAIRMQLDTGAIAMNGEDAVSIIQRCAHLVGHVHISEPDLVPPGDGICPHAEIAVALRRYLPDRVVTIEMLATQRESHLESVRRALSVAISHYREQPLQACA